MTSEERNAVVVGGGIAGLAAAASLVKAGWSTTVLEQATEFGEVGAGLGITPNGLTALDAIGAGDAVRAAGHRGRLGGTRARDGRWLMRMPDPPATGADPMTSMYGIHRQLLHAALVQVAAGAELVAGARVTGVDPGTVEGDRARVTWTEADDGRERERQADLVVGADGIRSTVRSQLYPDHQLTYSGFTSWRAVIDDPGNDVPGNGAGNPDPATGGAIADGRFVIVWGPEAEFGALRINDHQTYWYGYFSQPADTSFPDELAASRSFFTDWSPHVRAAVDATTERQLMRHDIWHLRDRLPSYVVGRAVLIGDAAHAMLPTMGQGANSSLEDGVSLGLMVPPQVDLASALEAYDRARRPRTQAIAARSQAVARLGAHVGGGWRQALRNSVMRLLPAGPAQRSGSRILEWNVPQPR